MNTNRHSIRLKKYDYSQNGFYFVTICTQNRENMFGKIVGARRDAPTSIVGDTPTHIELNQYGKIIAEVGKSLPDHHPIELDAFQIMPNHIHCIMHIVSHTSCNTVMGASRRAPTLGWIIGIFKTQCTARINAVRNTPGWRIFQRNYYEHIIRNEEEYRKTIEYIQNNPNRWDEDRNNPVNIPFDNTNIPSDDKNLL